MNDRREGPSAIDRLLGVFSDVHAGEGGRALLMLANIFLVLVSYYVLKTVREPLILDATDVLRLAKRCHELLHETALAQKGPDYSG